ncbi:hypothetical protein J3R83DRAFT_11194 [Lanmaoa asiatica]|nr:hypothetical protein J3R83DRAFT_11194 [Lanmaoa asiatica]
MTPVTNAPTFSVAYLETVRHVQYQMVAALSLLVWDLLLTLEEEMEYIWPMRHCVFKWFYFYFRYFLLAAQVFHLAVMPSLSSGRTPDFLCTMWYRYMVCILHASSCMIEIILATRVFALFHRSHRVGIFLSGLFFMELALAGSNISQCSAAEYFEACILPLPQKEVANPLA